MLSIFFLCGISLFPEIEKEKVVGNLLGFKNQLPVGTVITSTLEPVIFFQIYDRNHWFPADGSEAPKDSDYYKLKKAFGQGNTKLPDLRGRFVRGLNNFGTASQDPEVGDPETNRSVCSFQNYATAKPLGTDNQFQAKNSGIHNHSGNTGSSGQHSHLMNAAGSHTHNICGTGQESGWGCAENGTGDPYHGIRNDPAGQHSHSINENGGHTHSLTTSNNGNHQHRIDGGDVETRPRNIAVYFYVKINVYRE